MSTLKVDGIRSNSASSDAITLASDGTCTANITNKSNRNLIINGAMQVAQRGTSSSTDTNGWHTIDRTRPTWSNINNAITQAQVDTSSGDLPFTKGFRKAFKITNGDNTPATNTQLKINHIIESQDLACSGWDTVNSSSNVTLSFYVKSSVAQTFVVHLYADDANKAYAFEYSATTSWTRITHTIPGASGLTFNNDNGTGLNIQWYLYMGTDSTNNSFTNNAWGSYSSSSRSRDMTNTWYDTNDSTFEITGLQLEVGSVATDFEHKSYGQELALCQRYFQLHNNIMTAGYVPDNGSRVYSLGFNFPVQMRSAPSLSITQTGSSSHQAVLDGSSGANITSILSSNFSKFCTEYSVNLDADLTDFRPAITEGAGSSTRATDYKFSAEL
jgi:hypothetical protein